MSNDDTLFLLMQNQQAENQIPNEPAQQTNKPRIEGIKEEDINLNITVNEENETKLNDSDGKT